MTILSHGAGLRPTSAEILFPFLGFPPLRAFDGPDPLTEAGWADRLPAMAWDLVPLDRAGDAGAIATAGAQPQGDATPADRAEAREAPPAAGTARTAPEVSAAGRLKPGFATDPLHGLPAAEFTHARARHDLLDAGGRDWLDEAAGADSFVFLPAPEGPVPDDGAGSPAQPSGAEAWFDLLILSPAPVTDFGPDLVILPDHRLPEVDHVFF